VGAKAAERTRARCSKEWPQQPLSSDKAATIVAFAAAGRVFGPAGLGDGSFPIRYRDCFRAACHSRRFFGFWPARPASRADMTPPPRTLLAAVGRPTANADIRALDRFMNLQPDWFFPLGRDCTARQVIPPFVAMLAPANAALRAISSAIYQPNSLDGEVYAPDTPVMLS
ncbi:MAG: hypothetical protein KGL62_17485, partial [Bradyrhizobium sp.]|uniref:hypothetical protein n=1 Tax=Bradyrhizobium sp. TaxID=376 RepID=UPI00238B9A36